MEPLKEPLKGTLVDPFKGTPGFISSTVGEVTLMQRRKAFLKDHAETERLLKWQDVTFCVIT